MICAALVVCAAASASAQDAQPDPVAQMVHDAEAAKARQVDRALGAPAKAFEPLERTYPAPAAAPPATWTGQSSIPLVPIAIGVGALVVLLHARAAWRWAGDEPPPR
jgi:hypothetical protein